MRHAVELSNRVGLAQTEVMALESMGFALVFQGAYEEAQPWIEKAIAAARQARAPLPRHELHAHGGMPGQDGHVTEARARLVEAFELAQQIRMGFSGRRCSQGWPGRPGTGERKRLLQDGEAMLESSLAHARLFFYQDAIDTVLQDRNWDEALRYAEGLSNSCRTSPWLSPNWWPPAPALATRESADPSLRSSPSSPACASGLRWPVSAGLCLRSMRPLPALSPVAAAFNSGSSSLHDAPLPQPSTREREQAAALPTDILDCDSDFRKTTQRLSPCGRVRWSGAGAPPCGDATAKARGPRPCGRRTPSPLVGEG